MSAQSLLVAELKQLQTFRDAVQDRVYHETAPSSVRGRAYACYERVGQDRVGHLGGDTSLRKSHFQLRVFGLKSADLHDFVKAMETFDGARTGGSVEWIFVKNIVDDYVHPTQGQERGTKCVMIEISMWHRGEA